MMHLSWNAEESATCAAFSAVKQLLAAGARVWSSVRGAPVPQRSPSNPQLPASSVELASWTMEDCTASAAVSANHNGAQH